MDHLVILNDNPVMKSRLPIVLAIFPLLAAAQEWKPAELHRRLIGIR